MVTGRRITGQLVPPQVATAVLVAGEVTRTVEVEESGTFTTLDVRVIRGFDAGIKKDGVAVRAIDQGQEPRSGRVQLSSPGWLIRAQAAQLPLVMDREAAFV